MDRLQKSLRKLLLNSLLFHYQWQTIIQDVATNGGRDINSLEKIQTILEGKVLDLKKEKFISTLKNDHSKTCKKCNKHFTSLKPQHNQCANCFKEQLEINANEKAKDLKLDKKVEKPDKKIEKPKMQITCFQR
jgi:hypothetical protein